MIIVYMITWSPCTKAQSWPFRPQATFWAVPIPRPLAWAVESWPFRPKPKPLDEKELSCESGIRTHQSSHINTNTLNAITPESGMSQNKNPGTQVMRAGALIYDPPSGGVRSIGV
jgi:hypothetical protein